MMSEHEKINITLKVWRQEGKVRPLKPQHQPSTGNQQQEERNDRRGHGLAHRHGRQGQ